ncbi:MAG: addiction module protein [Propionivibrio sp.]|uniref:Addiction module protein n=1 Tax=Candidatus Propionivibrio dominans TaxID=2954373 RepID=A0A9D7FAE6_9RHOO|nr:addiction module protein [Candidatus Propionivibrio dominans]
MAFKEFSCKVVPFQLNRSVSGSFIKMSTEAIAMGNQLEIIEAEARKLTAGERAAFARILLASLDEDAEIEEALAIETERRIADIESGSTQVIPIADALAQVRAALK